MNKKICNNYIVFLVSMLFLGLLFAPVVDAAVITEKKPSEGSGNNITATDEEIHFTLTIRKVRVNQRDWWDDGLDLLVGGCEMRLEITVEESLSSAGGDNELKFSYSNDIGDWEGRKTEIFYISPQKVAENGGKMHVHFKLWEKDEWPLTPSEVLIDTTITINVKEVEVKGRLFEEEVGYNYIVGDFKIDNIDENWPFKVGVSNTEYIVNEGESILLKGFVDHYEQGYKPYKYLKWDFDEGAPWEDCKRENIYSDEFAIEIRAPQDDDRDDEKYIVHFEGEDIFSQKSRTGKITIKVIDDKSRYKNDITTPKQKTNEETTIFIDFMRVLLQKWKL